MIRIASILVLILFVGSNVAFAQYLFTWTPPTNCVHGYVLFRGVSSGAYSECYGVGNDTNYFFSDPMPAGVNYFVLTDFVFTNGVLLMSQWSNEIVLTNTPTLILEQVMLTSTNLNGTWLPWRTNRMLILPAGPARFFRPGQTSLTQTNIITGPPSP